MLKTMIFKKWQNEDNIGAGRSGLHQTVKSTSHMGARNGLAAGSAQQGAKRAWATPVLGCPQRLRGILAPVAASRHA